MSQIQAGQKTIVLFSGGKDSFLATCKLIEEGDSVVMVCFETFAGIASNNAKHGAKRIIEKYGADKAEFLGTFTNAGIWRQLAFPFFNMTPTEIIEQFGELTMSQFNCLTCRSAMYVWVIIKAKQIGVKKVADGTRKSQGFVIELPCMTERFAVFFKGFDIELVFPVIDLDDDWLLKNLLLQRGFVPKVIEPQCLVGAPLQGGKEPDECVRLAAARYFEKIIVPAAKKMIKEEFPITGGNFI
jgi:hypothetical protein